MVITLIVKNKKLVKIGDSYGFIVDMAYIRNGQISLEKNDDIQIEETSKANEKEASE